MNKHPIMFTPKVPKGKAEGNLFRIERVKRYLKIQPRKPPKPTINKDFIF
jgi:hypothetical protein